MSKFVTSLQAKWIGREGSRVLWELEASLLYNSDLLQSTVIVPAGFRTDFASVPRLPLAFLLAGDTAHEAAVVHDYLYSQGKLSRAECDAVFKEAIIVSGEPRWRAWLMYAGVRIGGGIAWQDHREAEAS